MIKINLNIGVSDSSCLSRGLISIGSSTLPNYLLLLLTDKLLSVGVSSLEERVIAPSFFVEEVGLSEGTPAAEGVSQFLFPQLLSLALEFFLL